LNSYIIMTLEECYQRLNGNYSEAKTRLMNDKLVDKFIRKFPADPSMQTLLDKVAEGNNSEAFRAVHTLKGVAGNLAFTQLQTDASNLTEQMRGEATPADPALLSKLKESYQLVIDTLAEYAAE